MGNNICKEEKYKEVSKRIFDDDNNYYVWIKYYNDDNPILIINKNLSLNPFNKIYNHDKNNPTSKIYNKIMNLRPEIIKPISNFILDNKIIIKEQLFENIQKFIKSDDLDKYLIIDNDRNIIKSKNIKKIIKDDVIQRIIHSIIDSYIKNNEYILLLPFNNNYDIYIQKILNTNLYNISKINI